VDMIPDSRVRTLFTLILGECRPNQQGEGRLGSGSRSIIDSTERFLSCARRSMRVAAGPPPVIQKLREPDEGRAVANIVTPGHAGSCSTSVSSGPPQWADCPALSSTPNDGGLFLITTASPRSTENRTSSDFGSTSLGNAAAC
jgi:hypothetical protein